jgi:DNA-binding IclR family transcriptional regulator
MADNRESEAEELGDGTVETASGPSKPYYLIQSVDRALGILQCFIEERRPLGVTEIARKLKLHKSVVHRPMLTLQVHGYLEQMTDTDKYMIGPKAFELGSVFANSNSLVDEGKRILAQLVERTGLTAHLAILSGSAVLYLVNVEPDHTKYLFGAVGQRRQIYNTALGKCLTAWLTQEETAKLLESCTFEKMTDRTIGSLEQFLAELEQVRQVGFAVDDEESAFGAHCYAAPIRNHSGTVVAAISASGFGLNKEKRDEMGVIMKSFASQLSRRMGHYGSM